MGVSSCAIHRVPLMVLLVLALAGCVPAEPAERAPTAVSLSPTACLSAVWSPSILPSMGLSSYNLLAGGAIPADGFIIGIWLYCDPSLVATDPNSAEYSEIGRLGLHSEWAYRGPTVEGGLNEVILINGEVGSGSGSGPRLQSGDIGASTGPVKTASQVAAKAAASGKPIQFTLRITVGGQATEATLTVLLKPFPDGYRLASAAISVPTR